MNRERIRQVVADVYNQTDYHPADLLPDEIVDLINEALEEAAAMLYNEPEITDAIRHMKLK